MPHRVTCSIDLQLYSFLSTNTDLSAAPLLKGALNKEDSENCFLTELGMSAISVDSIAKVGLEKGNAIKLA